MTLHYITHKEKHFIYQCPLGGKGLNNLVMATIQTQSIEELVNKSPAVKYDNNGGGLIRSGCCHKIPVSIPQRTSHIFGTYFN